ncbi:MAG: bifunctional riboflavin kinase/FAD synthetase [Pseudomonadota bacterium]
MFEIFSHNDQLPDRFANAVMAIGNFDGVHLGHQAVISAARLIAQREGRAALALTFSPHPRSFFKPDAPVFQLTSLAEKAQLFEATGLQGMIVKTFDAALAGMSADDFVAMLVDGYRASHIVAGYDFHFGKGRTGTPDVLRELAKQRGADVTLIAPQNGADNLAVSSSAIRDALENGDVPRANNLLGYRWFKEGEVQHGDKRGRALGFPTANVALSPDCRLKHGVYAARAQAGGFWYAAAVHFGGRIQFGGGAPLLEAHVLDFSGDLYGQKLRIEFIDFERAEEKFEDVEMLVRQMGRDVDAVRAKVAKAVAAPVTFLQAKFEQI